MEAQLSNKQQLINALATGQTALVGVKKSKAGNSYVLQFVTKVAKSSKINILKMLNKSDERIKGSTMLAYQWVMASAEELAQYNIVAGNVPATSIMELAILNPTVDGIPVSVQVTEILDSEYKGDRSKLSDNDYAKYETAKGSGVFKRCKSNGQDVIRRKSLVATVDLQHTFVKLDASSTAPSASNVSTLVSAFAEEGVIG